VIASKFVEIFCESRMMSLNACPMMLDASQRVTALHNSLSALSESSRILSKSKVGRSTVACAMLLLVHR
jgi:uncharacterized membrane protein